MGKCNKAGSFYVLCVLCVLCVRQQNSGVQEVAVYPPFMHPAIPWPPGVAHGARLRQEHDVQLLRSTLWEAGVAVGDAMGMGT